MVSNDSKKSLREFTIIKTIKLTPLESDPFRVTINYPSREVSYENRQLVFYEGKLNGEPFTEVPGFMASDVYANGFNHMKYRSAQQFSSRESSDLKAIKREHVVKVKPVEESEREKVERFLKQTYHVSGQVQFW